MTRIFLLLLIALMCAPAAFSQNKDYSFYEFYVGYAYERVDNKPKALVKDDEKIVAALKEDHEATLAYVRRPVGKTSAPLYSYFALVADDPSVQIVSQAQTWYLKDLLKETEYKDLPLLSAAAPFV